ncbi:hypothetical protein KKP04_01310 [Rhodomicrobium sp. Az07]|uniref:hypothetical protein n=1 Tax=Rhodomicrobium sp. Az07 TaxID=2839034 RepID=UPI001BE82937|nr:hypothetical protein [Rhodomicrobium sp. Az07]MBT3069508.1 hypothetical protein [Rhodomicrobium sp. Az07]
MEFSIKTPAKAAAFALAAVLLCNAAAAEEGPCEGLSWPMATELAWMQAADAEALKSGGEIAALPAKAVALALTPSKVASLPVKPSKEDALAPDTFSGFFTIKALPQKAVYQITLSNHSWIDVVQGGKPVETASFTGAPECKIWRKSVRFELSEAPVTIMVAGSESAAVRVAIREAQD